MSFLSYLINGISLGSIYAIIALGYTMVYGIARMLNFAHEMCIRDSSSADLMPCAFRCLVTLTPQENTEELKKRLLITKEELQRWQRLNMLLVDNRGI